WMSRAGALAAAQHAGGFLESAAGAGVEGTGVEQKGQPPESLAQIVQLVAEENPDFDQAVDSGSSEEGELPSGIDARLEVGVTANILEYDVEKISAEAGQTVRLVFKNTGNMEHNLLLLKPGTLQEVGGMADKMISSSEGREKGYVPNTPAVIGSTPIVQPGETYEITFEVPDEPGEYPYVCTIPGHWRSMRGVLVVEP